MADESVDTWIEQYLKETGLKRDPETLKTEPTFPDLLEPLDVSELKALLDAITQYYSALSKERALVLAIEPKAKRAVTKAESRAKLAAAKKKDLTNAELRKAFVEVDPAVSAAKDEEAKMVGMKRAAEARLKSLSKEMDRIGREIFIRTGKAYFSPGDDRERRGGGQTWGGTNYNPPGPRGSTENFGASKKPGRAYPRPGGKKFR